MGFEKVAPVVQAENHCMLPLLQTPQACWVLPSPVLLQGEFPFLGHHPHSGPKVIPAQRAAPHGHLHFWLGCRGLTPWSANIHGASPDVLTPHWAAGVGTEQMNNTQNPLSTGGKFNMSKAGPTVTSM